MAIADRKFSAAIIGCGNIGYFQGHKKNRKGALNHFKAIKNSKDFELKAITEIDKKKRKMIKEKYSMPTFSNYQEMLTDYPVDLIVVATPDETHDTLLLEILHYHPKVVFSEKPLATNLEAVNKIIHSYDKANVGLQVNYSRRFIKNFWDIKTMIDSSSLGVIQSIVIYYNRGLVHNGTHFIDLVLWYFGMPDEIFTESTNTCHFPNDITASVRFVFSNGMQVRLIGLNIKLLGMEEIDIIGSKGRVRINHNLKQETYRITDHAIYSGFKQFTLIGEKRIKNEYAIPNGLQNISDWLNKKKKYLVSPASNSREIFNIIAAIENK